MARARLTGERVRAALEGQLAALGLPAYGGSGDGSGGGGAGGLGDACVRAVRGAYEAGREPVREAERVAVRLLLDRLAAAAPGKSVEVRVPPYAAVQCVEGPRHTRGTPPNVVETDARTWIALATGGLDWRTAVDDGRVRASGARADISEYLPVS